MASELYIKIIAEDAASNKFRAIASEADGLSSSVSEAGEASERAGEQIDGTGQSLDRTTGSMDQAGDSADEMSSAIGSAGSTTERTGGQVDTAGGKVISASSAMRDMSGSANELSTSVGDAGTIAERTGGQVDTAGGKVISASSAMQEMRSSADEARSEMDRFSGSADSASMSTDNYSGTLSGARQSEYDYAIAVAEASRATTEAEAAQAAFNRALETYGAESSQAILAYQNLESANDNLKSSTDRVTDAQQRMGQQSTQTASLMDSSAVKMTTALSGVATSAFSLYSSMGRLEERTLAVKRAQLEATQSAATVESAQRSYNDAIEKYGSDSEDAQLAADKLSLATENYDLKVQSAEQAQTNLNNAQIQLALTVAPSVITGIKGISDAWTVFKNLDAATMIGGISDALITHKAALYGIAAAAAAAFFLYGAFTSDAPTIKLAFSILAGAAITLAAAQWAVAAGAIAAEEVLTLGAATYLVPVALGSAAAIYAASTMFGAADGALVKGGSGGTPIVVGEGSRDELIMPLPRGYDLSSMSGGARTVSVENNFYIAKTDDGDALVDKVVKATRRAARMSF